jgi:hypothetical protein
MQRYGKDKSARHNSPKAERKCRTCRHLHPDKTCVLKGRARAANKRRVKDEEEEPSGTPEE